VAQQIKVYKSVNLEFSEYIKKAIGKSKAKRDIYVEGYLAALLSKFIGKKEEFLSKEPFMYRLTNSKNLEDYIQLGDETLFITGFYPEIILKDKKEEYVVNIGKTSYKQAAVKLDYEGHGHIYLVLSKDFGQYSDVLNHVKYNMLEQIDDKEFFEIYKIGRDYKNPRAIEKLKLVTKSFKQ